MPSANTPIAVRAITRTAVSGPPPNRAKRPAGPPIDSAPAAAISSTRVGATGRSRSSLVSSALGMRNILPYGAVREVRDRRTRRRAAPTSPGVDGPPARP